jgi:2-iminobutanoate/2-iminopropanoate deaminase
MEKTAIQPEGLAVPNKPYVPVIVANGLVFVSGQIPVDAQGELGGTSFAEQLTRVIDNVEICLTAAGSSLADVLKATVYLTEREHFGALNDVYRSRFPEPRPVRTTILCGLMDERFLVEMDVVALAPGGAGR